jgi:hypothetical protein
VFAYVGFEKDHANWVKDANNWFQRARRGPGTSGGVNGTKTAYFYNGAFKPYGNSWGIVEGHGCVGEVPTPSCFPVPTADPSGVNPSFEAPTPDPSTGVAAAPCPPASAPPSASASVEPSLPPSEAPTQEPTKPPKPTPPPTPPPTAPPTAPPSAPPASQAPAAPDGSPPP